MLWNFAALPHTRITRSLSLSLFRSTKTLYAAAELVHLINRRAHYLLISANTKNSFEFMSISAYTHRHPLCRHIISTEFALVCLNKQTHTNTHVHRGLERDSVIMCRHQSAGETRKPLSTQRACHKKNNTSRIRHVSRIMNILLAKRSWLQFGRAPLSLLSLTPLTLIRANIKYT